jgi:N-acyl-D-aspartate/D-glutamate deacylase
MQGTLGPEMTVETFDLLACRTGRPILWSAILAKRDEPDYAPGLLDRFSAAGAHAIPQIACKPIVTQISLREPSTLGNIPAFQTALSVPASDRRELYRDRSWRLAMKREARELWGDRLERAIVRESSNAAELVNGLPLDEATPAGTDPLDYLLDVAIADDLATRFEITMINDDEDQIGALLRDERLVLSLSDAGAHASQLCDADYATHLLARWWRDREVLPLEQAIWRLTGHPASLFGFTDRGVVRPGCVADLVAFDPGSVAGGTLERVYDFPGGADRLVARSQGVRATWVAGELTRWEGALVEGAYPGALLRGTASGVR